MSGNTGPATVSTLREAEAFGQAGMTDLLYAVGITPQKLGRVSGLRQQGIDLKVIVDTPAVAKAIAEHATNKGAIPTLIEIDTDGHRSGVPMNDEARLIETAAQLDAAQCFAGVMTHAGGSYDYQDAEQILNWAERERSGAAHVADVLQRAGFTCPTVSIGSTPTALALKNTLGITEVRAGVYSFFDLFQAGVGVCAVDDIALSVLTTVIGHQQDKNWIITDSGWMALSADRSTAKQRVDQGYGLVCDIEGRPLVDLVVEGVNQEHGIISLRSGSKRTLPELPVGTRLRILPNHACATASQHAEYLVVEDGQEVVQRWPRISGW